MILSTILTHLTRSIQPTSQARTTQQMNRHEESIAAQNSSSPSFPSRTNFNHSSLTLLSQPQTPRIIAQTSPRTLLATIPTRVTATISAPAMIHSSSLGRNSSAIINNSRFKAVLPMELKAKPQPYKRGLIPEAEALVPSEDENGCRSR